MMQNASPHQGNDNLYQPPAAQPQGLYALPGSGMAVAGLVLGIIALLTSFLPIINNLAALLSVLGLIFGIVGLVGVLKGKKAGKGMAIAAVVLNAVAIVIVLATQAMFGAALDGASKALDESVVSTEDVSVSADAASSPASDSSADAPAAEAKYTIEGETMTQDDFSTKIAGTLTNNTDKEIGYLQVSYTLYDADGAQIGSAFANVNNLEAGGVWKFEAVSFESGVADYKLADVTGF